MEGTEGTMARAREVFEQSGLTLDELGRRMGYEGDVAQEEARGNSSTRQPTRDSPCF